MRLRKIGVKTALLVVATVAVLLAQTPTGGFTASSGSTYDLSGATVKIDGSLATGVLKHTITTGALSIAASGDLPGGPYLPLAGGTVSGATIFQSTVTVGVTTGIISLGGSTSSFAGIANLSAVHTAVATVLGDGSALTDIWADHFRALSSNGAFTWAGSIGGVQVTGLSAVTSGVVCFDTSAINNCLGSWKAVNGTITGGSLTISGNQSVAAWTTNGVRIKEVTGTLTDTTSSGTVAAAYTNVLGGNTIAASSATTFTNYYSGYFKAPTAGTNVTFTNKYALGADSLSVLGTLNTTGQVFMSGLTTSAGLQTAVMCIGAASEVIQDSVACLASAERYKTDIQPIHTGDALKFVMAVRPVEFSYRPEFNGALNSNPNYNGRQVGFIADQIQALDPRLTEVTTHPSSFMGVDYPTGAPQTVRYQNLTAMLAAAIQEQQKEIDTLRAQIANLRDPL